MKVFEMLPASKDLLSFLSSDQFKKLKAFFETDPQSLMIHQLVIATGTDRSTALAILMILKELGFLEVLLLIYHKCDPEVAMHANPIEDGFPLLPIYCGHCDKEITSYAELTFDTLAKIKA